MDHPFMDLLEKADNVKMENLISEAFSRGVLMGSENVLDQLDLNVRQAREILKSKRNGKVGRET